MRNHSIAPLRASCKSSFKAQRVLSTYTVERRVDIVGVTIMVWVGTPYVGTWDTLGRVPIKVPMKRSTKGFV